MTTTILGNVVAAMICVFSLPARAQESPASLSLVTDPDKAMVTCDGILRDVTPLTLDGLRPGLHLIGIEKTGFLPVRRTVTLVGGQRASLNIPLERLMGLVLLQSIPEGAEIEINGAHRGKAPLLLTDLPQGQYRVKASASGYLSRNVEFEVKDRVPQKVSVALASDSARLTIRSQPAGAAVTVNGLSKGITPCTLDRLPVGDAEVVLAFPDYETTRTTVKLQANEEQTLDMTLKVIPGSLSVISTPTGAKLFVDDALRGQTPVTLDGLSTGSHALRAEMDEYDPITRTVELKSAQRSVEEFVLIRNAGRLEVMAKPDGVMVVVDGQERGMVMPEGNQPVGQLSLELPVGEHKITFMLKGYGAVEKRITIQKGQTLVLKEVLKRSFEADTEIRLISGEKLTGILGEKLPDGDIKLETQLGIFKTIKASDVATIEKVKPGSK